MLFDLESYKKYDFAKLPEGGLEILKGNFLTSFSVSNDMRTSNLKKSGLHVQDITNTISTRKSSTSSNKSRKNSTNEIVVHTGAESISQKLIRNSTTQVSNEDCSKENRFVSLKCKGPSTPTFSETEKVIDLSQPSLTYEHASVVQFLLRKPKYSKEDKIKGKALCKFLWKTAEFEEGASSYRDSVERAIKQGNGFVVYGKDNKQKDIVYTLQQ